MRFMRLAHSRTSLWLSLSALTLLLISGCGFQLRGQYALPEQVKTLHVETTSGFNPLVSQLKVRLQQNGVSLLSVQEPNNAQLYVYPEKFERQTLSLFPNGQIAEYKLVYQVRFEIRLPNQEVQNFGFALTREFQDDPNNALAKERERELILSELRVLATERILSQLNQVQ